MHPSQHVLKNLWLNYKEPHVMHRVLHYADHYESHLPQPGRNVRMLEIGVQSGGSARSWKQYYGANLYYVGLDINPATRRSQSEKENMFVEIGSQMNASRLHEVCALHGPFDVVIDDGGHAARMITASLQAIFPHEGCMTTNGVYVVEDACTMMSKRYAPDPRQIYDLGGQAWWSMQAHTCTQKPRRPCCHPPHLDYDGKGAREHPTFRTNLVAAHLYESLAFFQRGVQQDGVMLKRGTDEIPYMKGT